jgi:hypothetical protein
MAYAMKELACDPGRIKGMSEKLIVSHYEDNYGGAVNRSMRLPPNSPSWTLLKPPADQRSQARGADRQQFDDPARDLFRLAW